MLYFPAVEPAAEPVHEETRESFLAQGLGETILLVEDDADIRSVLAEVLQEEGYTVLVAGDGEEGLRLFEQHIGSIALVIADIMMPNMQGRAFQEQVLQRQVETPHAPFFRSARGALATGDRPISG